MMSFITLAFGLCATVNGWFASVGTIMTDRAGRQSCQLVIGAEGRHANIGTDINGHDVSVTVTGFNEAVVEIDGKKTQLGPST